MSEKKIVALVPDPFEMKDSEILAAQNSEEPIEENTPEEIQDEPLMEEETPAGDLERLSQAIAAADAETAAELAEMAETTTATDEAAENARQLAQEIAEDEALAREAKEAEEAEEKADAELQAALPKLDENGEMDLAEMESCIESLLFMSEKPLSVDRLRDLLGPDLKPSVIQEALTALTDRCKSTRYGVEIVAVAGGYQMRTKPGRAALAKKLARVQTQKLSTGAMESLAIIAYRQPVMKEDIDKIRGVDSSYFVRGLLDKKLIRISGRSELPGRPMLYTTTHEFLELFGLKDLSAMPSLRELEQMVPASQAGNAEDAEYEDPRVKEMRKLVSQMNTDPTANLVYNPEEDEKILHDIRERVAAIPTSTPYLDEQKALEKQAAETPPPEQLL